MASVSVFVCPGASQLVTSGVPSCTDGAGAWQQVQLQEPFEPSTLNAPDLAGAFGAGWVVMGTLLAATWGTRHVFKALS